MLVDTYGRPLRGDDFTAVIRLRVWYNGDSIPARRRITLATGF